MRGVVTEPADEMTGECRAGDTARAVIECAANAIVAFGIDRTVLLWNPAAERMFGWAAGRAGRRGIAGGRGTVMRVVLRDAVAGRAARDARADY